MIIRLPLTMPITKNTNHHFNGIHIHYKMNNIPNIQQHLINELPFHMNHTDYTFQRNNTIHKYDNRRGFIAQQNYFHISTKR